MASRRSFGLPLTNSQIGQIGPVPGFSVQCSRISVSVGQATLPGYALHGSLSGLCMDDIRTLAKEVGTGHRQ